MFRNPRDDAQLEALSIYVHNFHRRLFLKRKQPKPLLDDARFSTIECLMWLYVNLRHTFGRRLRAAGVSLETRKALLGHANGDMTTHYSAVEIGELMCAVEKIANPDVAQTPTLTLVSSRSAA